MIESAEIWEEICAAHGWPSALAKATVDQFDYALGLADGTVIQFQEARPLCGYAWAHLINPVVVKGHYLAGEHGTKNGQFTFERGIDVRVSEIAWVCDAPWGS